MPKFAGFKGAREKKSLLGKRSTERQNKRTSREDKSQDLNSMSSFDIGLKTKI